MISVGAVSNIVNNENKNNRSSPSMAKNSIHQNNNEIVTLGSMSPKQCLDRADKDHPMTFEEMARSQCHSPEHISKAFDLPGNDMLAILA